MTTTDAPSAASADRALKARHAALWSLGDYPRVAAEVVLPLGADLVRDAGVAAGDRVLDVGAGTGNAAIPAALLGAVVTASDLTPALLDAGRRSAGDLAIDWVVADAEHLPFDDAAFDVVLSCIGVMFAPHHRAAADELVRVCRPGGTIALLSWTPEGFIGRLFAAMRPFAPAPPAGAQPAPLWGSSAHVEALLGDRVEVLSHEVRTLRVTRFATPEAFRDYFCAHYGPTIAVRRSLGDDHARLAALDEALVALARDAATDVGGTLEWEHLVTLARRR